MVHPHQQLRGRHPQLRGRRSSTLPFFQNIKVTDNYKQHNAALKWFRRAQENLATPCDLRFSNFDNAAVAALIKERGTDFDFNENSWTNWHWFEMVAQLDNQYIAWVVHGPDNRSRGLKECWLSMRPGSYDHKRHVQLKDAGRPKTNSQLRVWDFLLVRDDGSAVRLHPQWSTTVVDVVAGNGHEEEVQTPSDGFGESEGRGTFHWYKEVGVVKKVRFDAWKGPERKGKGKQKGKLQLLD